jgi:tetratricopeptide (TPR) repeat protein
MAGLARRPRMRRIVLVAAASACVAVAAAFLLPRPTAAPPVQGYAGSAACASCHPAEYAAWRESHHARAQEPPDRAGTARAFDHAPGARADGAAWVESDGPDGRRARRVEAAIGVSPLVQFLVAFDRGRLQPTAMAWDPRRREWFDLHAGEGRRPGEWGHWTGRGMTWNLQCASCHVTGYRKNYDAARDVYASAWVEGGVGCEACHGQAAGHAAGASAKGDRQGHGPARSAGMESCMPCHSRRRQVADDFVPGAPGERRTLLDVYEPVLPDDAAYYPDGQVLEEDYEWSSFLQSRMHAEGVTCRDCHEPHSAKLRAPADGTCLRCHEWRLSTPEHTRHPPASTGARCVGCHMPQTTYMLRHARRDHSMSIPRPRLTAELGIPNACSRCHRDKDTAWAAGFHDRWYGTEETPPEARARLVAAARRGRPDAVPGLLALMEDPAAPPVWRAAAAGLLQPWAERGDVAAALTRSCGAPDPLLRLRAGRALAPPDGLRPGDARAAALVRLLRDAARLVRVEAAWALRRFPPNVLRPAEAAALEAARAELMGALTWNADAPAGRFALATYHEAQGRTAEAERELAAALALDPRAGPARLRLAALLAGRGRLADAVALLEEGAALAGEDPQAHYALGIAYAQAGRAADAVRALETAVRLAPHDEEARRTLALARAASSSAKPSVTGSARARGSASATRRPPSRP